MATLVEHVESGNRYLVVGSGFGIYKASRPGLFGNLFPIEDGGNYHLIAVCDRTGTIKWFYSSDLQVVEVDGHPPEHWLSSV